MSMRCEECGRDDICLCGLDDADPTMGAIEIIAAARDQAAEAMDEASEDDNETARLQYARAEAVCRAAMAYLRAGSQP